jgi:hypothetical protein
MRKENAMSISTQYSQNARAIAQLVEDVQTDPQLQKLMANGTDQMKLEELEKRYGLGFDDLDAIYKELQMIFPEGRFWFW